MTDCTGGQSGMMAGIAVSESYHKVVEIYMYSSIASEALEPTRNDIMKLGIVECEVLAGRRMLSGYQ
jgi:hypothetical protein